LVQLQGYGGFESANGNLILLSRGFLHAKQMVCFSPPRLEYYAPVVYEEILKMEI
jgi:hypothetical protein